MRRISIHRSLHRADLIMGIERDLLFPIGIAAGVLIVSSGNRPWQILIGSDNSVGRVYPGQESK